MLTVLGDIKVSSEDGYPRPQDAFWCPWGRVRLWNKIAARNKINVDYSRFNTYRRNNTSFYRSVFSGQIDALAQLLLLSKCKVSKM